MLLVGFFENIGSERGIATRCADSLSLRAFLGYNLTETTPEHSTLSVIRRRLPASIYKDVFEIILKELKAAGLVRGKNLAVDSSVIEANASLSGLKNRMTAESYEEYIKKLASEAGVNVEDKAAVARFDRKRQDRKTDNKTWFNPDDPDAKIGKTKHGATSMIYKPEHVVDLDTGALLDANILPGDKADSDDITGRISEAQDRLDAVADSGETLRVETATADKGYYKDEEIIIMESLDIATVIPDRLENRKYHNLSPEEIDIILKAQTRVKSEDGRALLKRRGSTVERSFAHVLDCGGARRTTLRGEENISKRYGVVAAAFNLSLLMRKIYGVGTPKQFLACFKQAVFEFFVGLFCDIRNFKPRFGMFKQY
jgi:transposase